MNARYDWYLCDVATRRDTQQPSRLDTVELRMPVMPSRKIGIGLRGRSFTLRCSSMPASIGSALEPRRLS